RKHLLTVRLTGLTQRRHGPMIFARKTSDIAAPFTHSNVSPKALTIGVQRAISSLTHCRTTSGLRSGGASNPEWNNEPDGPRRIGLRAGDARQARQRGSTCGHMQELSSVRKFHAFPPRGFEKAARYCAYSRKKGLETRAGRWH